MTRIAVASTDKNTINEHFGQAKEFIIYKVEDDGNYDLLEIRRTVTTDQEENNHNKIAYTAEILADIDIVLASEIGPKAANALERKGIIPLAVNGPIEKALKSCGKRARLIKNISLSNIKSCSSSGYEQSCDCSKGCCG